MKNSLIEKICKPILFAWIADAYPWNRTNEIQLNAIIFGYLLRICTSLNVSFMTTNIFNLLVHLMQFANYLFAFDLTEMMINQHLLILTIRKYQSDLVI